MAGEGVDDVRADTAASDPTSAQLIAGRLRQAASLAPDREREAVVGFSVESWLEGDAGHLHRAADLRTVPIRSHRRLTGWLVVRLKRTTRRLLFPLLDVQ